VTDASPLPTYTGARVPDRIRRVDAHGIGLAVYEWGDEDAPPLALVHGGFDFARTFDVFAPLLAAGGWRVVAWDQRGHGDSDHVALYSWTTDVRDAVSVLASVTDAPLPVVGHSKGGSLMLDLASTLPGRVSALVNIDGLPSRRNLPDVADHQRTKLMAGELASWLDFRRSTVDAVRKPGTIEELADRRSRMNPRLTTDWLRYLVTVGARQDDDGWRWKIDPTLRLGGFGPFRPEWALGRLALLEMPVLALLGQEPEVMGWGTRAEDVLPHLPPGGDVREMHGVGHFIHIEQPEEVAGMVLDFLEPLREGPAPRATAVRKPTRTLRHNRVDLALYQLRATAERSGPSGPGDRPDGADRPLLLLHALGSASPDDVPAHLATWPGPVWALDFTGHGASTTPPGGGYFAEVLMGDVDAALAELGPCTLYGRGLGAYVALLTAGARPDMVRGAVLDDGAGLHGGGGEPVSGFLPTAPLADSGTTPDPYALIELSRDLRPGDYASTFARQAATLSGLDVAVAVVGSARPPWLREVLSEPGVQELSRADALDLFAKASTVPSVDLDALGDPAE
jgi:pimeloyl-ACP methyl ester carboxylesterase